MVINGVKFRNMFDVLGGCLSAEIQMCIFPDENNKKSQ